MITGLTNYKYEHYYCQQHPNFQEPFRQLLATIKPNLIIEIGTGSGAFSIFLNDVMTELNLTYRHLTYDIRHSTENIYMHNQTAVNKIEERTKDVFEDVNWLSYIINNKYETVLVLCDGADKVKEFKTFAPLIKDGDFIMGHDYAITEEYFNNNVYEKIWNWLELPGESIQSDIEENNLQYYMNDEFSNIVWLCMQKNNNL